MLRGWVGAKRGEAATNLVTGRGGRILNVAFTWTRIGPFVLEFVFLRANKALSQRNTRARALGQASSTNTKPCFVTYWLNALQHLKTETDVFVSLNPVPAPASHLVHRKMSYSHPQYSPDGAKAQIGTLGNKVPLATRGRPTNPSTHP